MGNWCQNDVVLTLIRRYFYAMCRLGMLLASSRFYSFGDCEEGGQGRWGGGQDWFGLGVAVL